MLEQKAGLLAGKVWVILNENGPLTEKEILRRMKTRKVTDFYLALGWLLREGKLNTAETEGEVRYALR